MSDVREARPGTTPGVLGYALAVALSLVVFAVELGIADVVLEGGSGSDGFSVILIVLIFGAVPAVVIGTVGAGIVHLLTRRAATQAWAVAVAALLGVVAGLLVYEGEEVVPGVLLGIATGIGRLAVVPLADRPQR